MPQAIGLATGAADQAPEAAALADALAAVTAGTVYRLAPVDSEAAENAPDRAGLDLIVVSSGSGVSGAPDLDPLALDIIERVRYPVLIVPAAKRRVAHRGERDTR